MADWKLSGLDTLDEFLESFGGDARPLLEGLHRVLADPFAAGAPDAVRHPMSRLYEFGPFLVRATVVEQFKTVHVVDVVAI